ncbi:MAG TPA: helix-turn-helix domain-containing protein [Chloroflexota bacterium]|nr:helix-turn-helix domain-containing protein [Chloroflexota bacterium]
MGFSPHEARVYVALLQRPSATGYELAKATGLPRANVYHVLGALQAKNAIQAVADNPTRYVAHAPASVLGRIKNETIARCDALTAELTALAPTPEPAALWTLRGRDAVVERIAALIAEASSRVAICLWNEDVPWLAERLRAAEDRGCQVIINMFGPSELDVGEVYWHEEPAKVVGGHVLTLAVDWSAALVAVLDEPIGAVYTRHPALVQLVEKLIRDEAYLAEIYQRFRTELEAAYGQHLVQLRRRLLPAAQAERLLAIVGFGAAGAGATALLGGE